MADDGFGDLVDMPPDGESDASAYAEGYRRAMRELAWVRAHGWPLTERQVTVALMHAMKVYATARGGKFVSGQRPEWLHGRADALRTLLREGLGAPSDGD